MLIRKSEAASSSTLVTDQAQNVYELVIASYGQRPSELAEEYSQVSDPYFAFQWVNSIGLNDFQWHQILSGLIGHSHSNSISHEAAQLISGGKVRVYKLPSIKSAGAIPLDEKSAYQFHPSIVTQYASSPHRLEKFNSVEKAQALVNGIKWSGSALTRVASDLRMDQIIQEKIIKNGSSNLEFGKQEIIKFLSEGKAVVLKVERITATPSKQSAAELAPLRANDKPPPLAPETKSSAREPEEKKTDFSARKGVEPASLNDAANRLDSMKTDIDKNGYQPKYTDEELLQQAQDGKVANERYHVRFMEVGHQWDRKDAIKDSNNLTGKLGREFSGATGTGPRYWSTTFDQIEDADSDPRLICRKLGIDHDPSKKYAMVIIDTEKAKPLTGCECVSATFGNISAFANRELPSEFPKSFTDKVMTHEFQVAYKDNYQKALDGKFLTSQWSTNPTEFSNYLNTTGMSGSEKDLMLKRMAMHDKIGNNNHYLGNGVTEDKIPFSPNKCGAVETHNFERTPTDLQKLKDNNAIKIVYL
jgi:hypothetical protein